MELILIRHGRPVRIDEGVGPADPELAEQGRLEAAALAEWLGGAAIDQIYTSPLRRARETAAPLAGRLDLEPMIEERLAEFDRDATWYIPMEDLRDEGDPRWQELVAGDLGQYETDVEVFRESVVGGVQDIADRHPGRRVAVVCHGGVINAYLADVLDLDSMLFFHPDYTSISRVLVARSGARSLQAVNETGHLVVASLRP